MVIVIQIKQDSQQKCQRMEIQAVIIPQPALLRLLDRRIRQCKGLYHLNRKLGLGNLMIRNFSSEVCKIDYSGMIIPCRNQTYRLPILPRIPYQISLPGSGRQLDIHRPFMSLDNSSISLANSGELYLMPRPSFSSLRILESTPKRTTGSLIPSVHCRLAHFHLNSGNGLTGTKSSFSIVYSLYGLNISATAFANSGGTAFPICL